MKENKKMRVGKYSRRNWAVYAENGELICVTVYKKGAKEVLKRLEAKTVRNKP